MAARRYADEEPYITPDVVVSRVREAIHAKEHEDPDYAQSGESALDMALGLASARSRDVLTAREQAALREILAPQDPLARLGRPFKLFDPRFISYLQRTGTPGLRILCLAQQDPGLANDLFWLARSYNGTAVRRLFSTYASLIDAPRDAAAFAKGTMGATLSSEQTERLEQSFAAQAHELLRAALRRLGTESHLTLGELFRDITEHAQRESAQALLLAHVCRLTGTTALSRLPIHIGPHDPSPALLDEVERIYKANYAEHAHDLIRGLREKLQDGWRLVALTVSGKPASPLAFVLVREHDDVVEVSAANADEFVSFLSPGSALLRTVFENAIARGKTIRILANLRNARLYIDSWGFVGTSAALHEKTGIPILHMERRPSAEFASKGEPMSRLKMLPSFDARLDTDLALLRVPSSETPVIPRGYVITRASEDKRAGETAYVLERDAGSARPHASSKSD